jgi:hypothetical protein
MSITKRIPDNADGAKVRIAIKNFPCYIFSSEISKTNTRTTLPLIRGISNERNTSSNESFSANIK